MRSWLLLLTAGAVTSLAAGCGSSAPGDADVTSPTPGGPPSEAAYAGLPKTDDGRPILIESLFQEQRVQLVVDTSKDDGITRWASCLERAVTCAQPDEAAATACLNLLPRCDSDLGGDGCCPAACLDRFATARAAGKSVGEALDVSLAARDCVAGVPGATP